MKQKLSRILFITLLVSIFFTFDVMASSPMQVEISGPTEVSAGETVTLFVTAEIEGGSDIQGIQVDFSYSFNFPTINNKRCEITANSTSWENVGITKKNLLAVGNVIGSNSKIVASITFDVPNDAKVGESYVVKVEDAIAAYSNGEITADILSGTLSMTVAEGSSEKPDEKPDVKPDVEPEKEPENSSNNGSAVGGNDGSDNVVDDNISSSTVTWTNPFTDVKMSDWFYKAVEFASKEGITSGVSATSFAPNDKVTRGQFVTMLCRAYGVEEMTGDNFADCGDTWYTGYLAAAKQLGISNGVGDNKFAPEKEITREEMVTLIYNYLKSIGEVTEGQDTTSFADDAEISEWAKAGVAYANENGIVNGKGDNKFAPKDTATRAELVQIFYNIFS